MPGTNPSIFAVELETLAMRAFGDLSQPAHLQLVRDRFIDGQVSCTLRRHLDSVAPGHSYTGYRRQMLCVGESCRLHGPTGRQPHPKTAPSCLYDDDGGTGNGPARATADITPEDQELLGSLMRHLLPTPVVSPPKVTPIHSECDLLLQHLMGNCHPVQPLPQERSSFTDMEILLQNLLLVGSPMAEQSRLTERQTKSMVVCFLCGESGYAASRYPILDDMFLFLPMGWQADRVGDL